MKLFRPRSVTVHYGFSISTPSLNSRVTTLRIVMPSYSKTVPMLSPWYLTSLVQRASVLHVLIPYGDNSITELEPQVRLDRS